MVRCSWLIVHCSLILLVACTPPAAGVVPTFVPPPTPAPSSGQTYTVAYGSIVEAVETRGRVVAKQEASLVFPLGGALKAVHVLPGDQVKAGALLAEIDAPEAERAALEAQFDVESAEAGLKIAEAGLQSAQLALKQARTLADSTSATLAANELARAEHEYEQAWEEWDKAVHRWWEPPEATEPYTWTLQLRAWDREAAQLRLADVRRSLRENRARLELGVARAELDVALAEIEVKRARALNELAAEQLASTQLKAPFSGIIISLEKRAGDWVSAYEAIGVIADPSELWVVATVPEEDIAQVTAGRPVSVRLDAYPDQVYTGTVLQVASQAIIWQGKSAYEVTVAFDEGQDVPATIRMGADVTITGRSRENVLVVPARAVITIGGRAYVERVGEDGGLERVEVQTGVSNGTETEIVAGLQEGQEIRIP